MTLDLDTPQVVTRWHNGEVSDRTTARPTPFNASRAKNILRDSFAGDFHPHMSDGEIAYVKAVWDTMPGNTSFASALYSIANR